MSTIIVDNENGGGGGGGGINYDGSVSVGTTFLARRTGTSLLGRGTGISSSVIISLHALASFTNTVGVSEVGSTVNSYTLNWTYNRNSSNPASQSLSTSGSLAVALRTLAVTGAGITTDTTITLSAVGDDVSWGASVGNPSSLTTSILFRPSIYHGVDNGSPISTGSGIMTAFSSSAVLSSSRAVTYTFDASVSGGSNYLYIAYPSSFGAPSSTRFNGFAFTDYTSTTSSLTNASGNTETYIILRTNSTYSGSSISWQVL